MRLNQLAVILAAVALPARAQTPPAAPAPAPLPSVTLPADLARVLTDYERAWRAGDEAALTALFTEDGFVAAGQGWVRGREAIRVHYENSQGDLHLRALAYAVQDTVGYIVGAYGYGGSAPVPDRGKFVLALRRAPGGPWLIAADLDQSNRQPR